MTDYSSPKEWGPHFWYMMRCIAHNYSMEPSDVEKANARRFYETIGSVLPCEKCKKHYIDTLKKYPISQSVCCKDCLKTWVEKVYKDTPNGTSNTTPNTTNVASSRAEDKHKSIHHSVASVNSVNASNYQKNYENYRNAVAAAANGSKKKGCNCRNK